MNKKKLIIIGVVLLVLIIIIFILISIREKKYLQCTIEKSDEGYKETITINLVNKKSSKYYIQKNVILYDESLKDFVSFYVDFYNTITEDFTNNKGFRSTFIYEDDKIIHDLEINMSQIDQEIYTKMLPYDYLNSTVEESKAYLEKEGYLCAK